MLPVGFAEKMERLLGAEFSAFSAALALGRSGGLRLNPARRSEPLPQFCGERVAWCAEGWHLLPDVRPGLHPYHDAGVYYLQEPSAMAPAALLAAQPGERVLDLCAAPGGKTTQLAAAMRGRGLLVANEIHPKRARVLASNIERMGVTNALVLNEHPTALAARFPAWFDRILVDAPCSGEGMFRKEPAALADWSPQTVRMCADRQYEILCTAATMLRAGGRLVYSTCTFSPEEDEEVVARFLRTHSDFSVVDAAMPCLAEGRPDWMAVPDERLRRAVRLWPHRLDGEGQFAAVLQRDGGACGETDTEPLQPTPREAAEFFRTDKSAFGVTAFGDTLWLAPEGLPRLRGLHVLRVGTELGELRKGRFLPAHAAALALETTCPRVSYPADSPAVAAYLRGETLPAAGRGWTLVCVDGYPLGWAKAADGVLKNHYPKGLRRAK